DSENSESCSGLCFSTLGNNRHACCTPLPVPPPHGGRERCGTTLPNRKTSIRVLADAYMLLRLRGDERSVLLRLIHIFSCQTAARLAAREPVAFRQKNIDPCSVAGRGGSPDFRFLSSPSHRGGRRADKAQCPDCSGRGVRIAPDDECTCDAPRALRRTNA